MARIQPAVSSASTPDLLAGPAASARWLTDRRLSPPDMKRWHVEIALATVDNIAPVQFDERIDSRFHIDLYAEEWGFFFCHGGRASWIRVTDIAFVHGRDDFRLLDDGLDLCELGALLRTLEQRHQVQFRRDRALVRSNLTTAERSVRRWVQSL